MGDEEAAGAQLQSALLTHLHVMSKACKTYTAWDTLHLLNLCGWRKLCMAVWKSAPQAWQTGCHA